MARRTVLQVIPALEAGGAERTTLDIARALVAQGDRALVVSSGGRLEDELAARGGELIRLNVGTKNPAAIITNIDRLRKIIREEKVDLIHARSRAPAWSSFVAARSEKIPFVTTYHGTYSGKTPPKKVYNSIMARSDRVIANSKFIAAHVAQNYPWAVDKTVTIARGTDMALFDPEAVSLERRLAARAALGLQAGEGPAVEGLTEMGADGAGEKTGDGARRPVVLLPGRLTRWKGQVEFIDAFAQLKAQEGVGPGVGVGEGGAGAVGVMVGDPQGREAYVAELEAMIAERGLEDRVRLTGHVSDMPAVYLCADLVVSASNEPEAFGRVTVEAQAMGRPVIATDHGGTAETIRRGSHATGWTVPPGDAATLAARIDEVLKLSAYDRNRVASRAQKWVRQEFSVDVMCAATLGVYADLLSRGCS